MKKIAFLFLILVFSLAFKNTTINNFPLFGRTLIIDVGHGSEDPGSIYNNDYEKDYNLAFAKTLYKSLSNYGANVMVIRDGDYDLSNPSSNTRKKTDFENRIRAIDESSSDMYISLHMNYLSDTRYYGAQAFYSTVNSKNKEIASIIQDNFNKYFNYDKPIKKIDDSLFMYKRIKTRGVLIEYGFISSSKDRKNLKNIDYQNELANIISMSIITYFS